MLYSYMRCTTRVLPATCSKNFKALITEIDKFWFVILNSPNYSKDLQIDNDILVYLKKINTIKDLQNASVNFILNSYTFLWFNAQ